MQASSPAAAYRRVALEARIEAASGPELTRICLEEAVAELGRAQAALERGVAEPPRDALSQAQVIVTWLAATVAPDHPLGDTLRQFYGALAAQIGANLLKPSAAAVARVRGDLTDLLEAARAA